MQAGGTLAHWQPRTARESEVTQSANGGPSAPPGSIEFEVADFADARRVLDQPPPGVAEVATMRPGYWEERRRRAELHDRALTSETIRWMLSLPAPVRPHELCKRFPRLGNTIAQAWPRADSRVSVLAGLVRDTRGRRAGFPPGVRKEIEALLRTMSPSAKSPRR